MKLRKRDYRLNLNKPRNRLKYRIPTLLIVGCGDVGLRLVRWLREKHPASRLKIVATARNPNKQAAIRLAGAMPYLLDLDATKAPPQTRRKSLKGFAHWMINLSPPPNDSPGTDKRSLRLTTELAQHPSNELEQRWVYISTSGIYGDCQGQWVEESRPARPKNIRAVRRVAGEGHHRAKGACILRAPGIYGHDRLPIDRLKAGTPALTHNDDIYTNHIHALDLAILSWLALFRGHRTRVFNASDDSQMKMADYFDQVADAFGLPRPNRVSRDEIALRVSPMMLSFMVESRRLINARIKKELRAQLRYPTVAHTLATAGDLPLSTQ
jgi:nucleoside-diphosphate-sugar epimerase